MKITEHTSMKEWTDQVIKQDQIDKYLINGKDFINEQAIQTNLKQNQEPDKSHVREILQKSLQIERLSPSETATLLHVKDKELWQEMYETGLKVKQKVYDNRIVFFAPLYCGNYCVNNCRYCGFRSSNKVECRKILSPDEIVQETEAVIAEGHKRMIAVYGEHPYSDIDYMVHSLEAIYSARKKAPHGPGTGNIRRINVNAPPMSVEDLKRLHETGIGTYQVFQETYHRPTYKDLHTAGPKAHFQWRLYTMHRAMEAGIDDMGIGALFGLYDWKYEVMGLLYHAIDLERQFGIGPHTISFPRLTPANNSDVSINSKYKVSDEDFKKLVTVIRLAVPYTGLIITARERPELRMDVIDVGCTQTDASTKIGIGGYTEALKPADQNQGKPLEQVSEKQQFMLGDTRNMDEVVRELAYKNMITSFCTAGYRCGRTGDKIMGLLKGCVEGKFCKLNAVLTFREYLDDYASEETKTISEQLIQQEIKEIQQMPFFKENKLLDIFKEQYQKIIAGERDLYL